MKIAVGSDHGGFELKESILGFLNRRGLSYHDFGTHSADSCDYPLIAYEVGSAVAQGDFELGLLFCGTGIGISIAANKIAGVRAACCSDCFSARHARLHNDANILCLGGRVVGPGLAEELVGAFLDSHFSGGRHQRRVGQISAIEAKEPLV